MNKFSYKGGEVECQIRGDGTQLNSLNCSQCNHFVAGNRNTSIIVCDAKLKCPDCGSVYQDVGSLSECIKECSCDHEWGYEICHMDDEVELDRKCTKCSKFEEICLEVTQEMMESIWNG